MKPILVNRKNKNIGARVKIWTDAGYDLGVIVEGKEKRTFRWNWNNFYKEYMSEYECEGYLVKCDKFMNLKGNNILPFREDSIKFLERIVVEKPRQCPDFEKILKNMERHEIENLKSLLNETEILLNEEINE